MEDDWVTIGIVCRLPIMEIPKIKKLIDDKGKVVYSRISGKKIYLVLEDEETSPSGGVYINE